MALSSECVAVGVGFCKSVCVCVCVCVCSLGAILANASVLCLPMLARMGMHVWVCVCNAFPARVSRVLVCTFMCLCLFVLVYVCRNLHFLLHYTLYPPHASQERQQHTRTRRCSKAPK